MRRGGGEWGVRRGVFLVFFFFQVETIFARRVEDQNKEEGRAMLVSLPLSGGV